MIDRALASLRLRAADAIDSASGRSDARTPPRRLSQYVGGGDFRGTGEEFLGHFRQFADLQPGDRVLEIGCGIGRMARVLAGVLAPPGAYDGFDVVGEGITWCQAHYRDTPAPFAFRHADLRNAEYNPTGSVAAAEYRFPYLDAGFDLVIATSVFTHLLAADADHYLEETARVLTPGGRLFATWYLIEDRPCEGGHRAAVPAPFTRVDAGAPVALRDPEVPEAAVAFDESWVRERLAAHGLSVGVLQHGSWRGTPGASLQDIVVAYRD